MSDRLTDDELRAMFGRHCECRSAPPEPAIDILRASHSHDCDTDEPELRAAVEIVEARAEIARLTAELAAARAVPAAPVATVGGLLATAPVGSIVEWCVTTPDGWLRAVAGDRRAMGARYLMSGNGGGCWSKHAYAMTLDHLRAPARLVPASEADRDPSTRGPLPQKGG